MPDNVLFVFVENFFKTETTIAYADKSFHAKLHARDKDTLETSFLNLSVDFPEATENAIPPKR